MMSAYFMNNSRYLHVLHVFVEQVVHASDEALRRLLPPPMPKEEKSFCTL
jgi:hypothetical protein